MGIFSLTSSLYKLIIESFGLNELFFYFMFYSFCGCIIENLYSFFTKGVFKKEVFLKGPFKPMYGSAPVILLVLLSKTKNWFLIILLCFLVPSFVEYISGFLLEKLFNRKWWDYSDMPMQLHGYISLRFSVYWIFLSLLMLYIIHPLVRGLYLRISYLWTLLSPLVFIYFISDLLFTIISLRREKSDIF
ncbi:putative ABC transporter permease [Hathewaya histolytica]|uniref:putative ABC transporter permease n=1 Tax=Hathewaya histolytica TaxID=1498 RepID=UPI003B66B6B2